MGAGGLRGACFTKTAFYETEKRFKILGNLVPAARVPRKGEKKFKRKTAAPFFTPPLPLAAAACTSCSSSSYVLDSAAAACLLAASAAQPMSCTAILRGKKAATPLHYCDKFALPPPPPPTQIRTQLPPQLPPSHGFTTLTPERAQPLTCPSPPRHRRRKKGLCQ